MMTKNKIGLAPPRGVAPIGPRESTAQGARREPQQLTTPPGGSR